MPGADEDSVQQRQLRRDFCARFYNLEYNDVRKVLLGCRNLFDQLLSAASSDTAATTVGVAVRDLGIVGEEHQGSDAMAASRARLVSLGFPDFSNPQAAVFIESLTLLQLAELVRYATYQLASEAYLYCNLPRRMAEPLRDEDEQQLVDAILRMTTTNDADAAASMIVVNLINEFCKDILSLYEGEMVKGVLSSSSSSSHHGNGITKRHANNNNNNNKSPSSSLRQFMLDHNFCDDRADRIFALLPTTITLRQYICLRQCLHQVKLALLLRHSAATGNGDDDRGGRDVMMDDDDGDYRDDNNNHGRFKKQRRQSRGRCWLWEDDVVDDDNMKLMDDNNDSVENHNNTTEI